MLSQRNEHLRTVRSHLRRHHIGRDTDHGVCLIRLPSGLQRLPVRSGSRDRKTVEPEHQPLPHGILAGKQLSRQGLRNHDDGRRSHAVLSRDASPSKQADAQSVEITLIDARRVRAERRSVALGEDSRGPLAKIERHPVGDGHLGDTGRLPEVLRQLLEQKGRVLCDVGLSSP